jgi:hypothetical protein
MAVVCHCPNCLGEVIGRFQRTCVVCGREIPVDLRMAGVAELEAYPVEVRRASTLQQRVFAVAVSAPVALPDPNPFEEEAADERSADEPREMDWEDDEPAEPARRRRWFRR